MADAAKKKDSESKDEPLKEEDDDDDEENGEEEDDEEEEPKDLFYDEKEFAHLDVSADVRQVFSFISLYTPRVIELEFELKPFIPDFIPAVGDIDPFIKVPRPDGKDEELGLTVLDEPIASRQSDPSLMALRLRAVGKDFPLSDQETATPVRTVTRSRDIDDWIAGLRTLHQETGVAAPAVAHSIRLPEMERLMQEWHPDFEEALIHVSLPPPDLTCDLAQYAALLCALVDIPVRNSRIASLHHMFCLYNEFRSSQHFKQID